MTMTISHLFAASCVALVLRASLCQGALLREECEALTSCVKCTENKCSWNSATGRCASVSNPSVEGTLLWDDTCTVNDYQSVKNNDNSFPLSDWMGKLFFSLPEASTLSLLDISLPGTHDTLTYDLSLRVSDGGIDNLQKLATTLHLATDAIPGSLEDYFRQQAQTQGLSVTQQLDSGVRFLDLRIIFEYSDVRKKDHSGDSSEWFSLHMMQSNHLALDYLKEIRRWLDAHPQELVVLWISKHGSECATGDEQYPNTPAAAKQLFWTQIQEIFAELLFDNAESSISYTPVKQLIETKQRVVIYAADWKEFTASSSFAIDSCTITNLLGPGVSNETAAIEWERNLLSTFGAGTSVRKQAKEEKKFLVMSMATSVPGAQMTLEALIKYLPGSNKELNKKCTEAFRVPGMTVCPETLLDIATLENYYKQLTLEQVMQNTVLSAENGSSSWGYPNAIYINAVDFDGTIRTGTQTMWKDSSSRIDSAHGVSAYSYVDNIILYNTILAGCGNVASQDQTVSCKALQDTLMQRRSRHPLLLWEDKPRGRLTDWTGVIA